MQATVPVLMYHHVSPVKGDMVSVTPEVFEGQMRHIKDSGLRTLSLDELMRFMQGGLNPDERSVVITFDDGYLDNYIYAYPVLKSLGLKATIFVVTDWVDRATLAPDKAGVIEEYRKKPLTHADTKALVEKGEVSRVSVDWQMIKEMLSGSLIEFYSHTMSHRSADRLAEGELQAELAGSRKRLEEMLGSEARYLCWPKGRYNDVAMDVARRAGYMALFTTRPGVVKKGADPLAIKRIVVKDSIRWLKLRLAIYTNPVLAGAYLAMRGKRG